MKYFVGFLASVIFIISCTGNDKRVRSDSKLDYYFQEVYNNDLSKNQKLSYLDSAKNIVDLMSDKDSLKVKNVFKVANRYYALLEYDNYLIESRKALSLSKLQDDSLGIAKGNYYIGDYYFFTSKNDSAYYYYLKAEKKYNKLNDKYNLAKTMLHIAYVLLYEKDFLGSEAQTIKVLNIAKELRDQGLIYECYVNLGSSLAGLKNYEKSLEYHFKALKQTDNLQKDIYTPLYKAQVLNNIGYVYLIQNKFDKALEYYSVALKNEKVREIHPVLYSSILDYYAYSNFKLNNDNALKDFNNALKIRDSINDTAGKIKSRTHLSEYYLGQKDTVKAWQLNEEAYKLAKASRYNIEVLTTLDFFTQIDPKNGLKYAKEYIRLSDSLQDMERNTRNKLARIKYETDEILSEKEKISSEKNTILYGALAITFFGVLLFIIFYQRNKQKQLLLTQEQQQANEEIYQLMLEQQSKLDNARSFEKKRIARELHDGVMNKLASTRLNLFILNKKTDPETIQKCLAYINEIQNIEKEVRGISHELSNESLFHNQNNFNAILEELCEEQETVFGTKCIREIDQNITWDTISASVKMNLYRIIQEAMNNCNKYAKAKTLFIKVSLVDNELKLLIKDDGIGFNTDKVKKGIGLKNIKERTDNIDGQFKIFSEIGTGTTLLIKINLAANHG
ncbi:ATP-binding protein [Flavobacterium sediminis]|uniref:ATP-binding protein n=1 Tax=Flavobacterium sediminis TaxID=2201181 RepID=A0A2U8QTP7_9FLAO|nr:sensor histidine kinase [Flavobacterium sediminis]AWM13557.1 ATP-binding protein [Flavobacterium sediminis]